MTEKYVHALRYRWLNRFYDPAVGLLTREMAYRNRLLELVTPRPGERVLDLGCGSGTFLLMLGARQPGAELHGLDGDDGMLDQARAKARKAGCRLELQHADARRLPYPDGFFDQVCSTLFFHHLGGEARRQVLEEAARVLKPGGRLLIADWGPAADPLQWILSWPVRCWDGLGVTRDNFTGRLPGQVRSAGFERPEPLAAIRTPAGTLHIMRSCLAEE